MSKNKRLQILLKTTGSLLAAALYLTGCGEKQESTVLMQEALMKAEQANYKTISVEEGDYQKEVTGNASVIYLLHSDLCWENSTVYYRECRVKTGQEVKKGDILMLFDAEKYQLELEKLSLQLQRTRERFEEENAERAAELNAARAKTKDLKDYELKIAEWNIEKKQAEYEQFLYESDKEIRRMEEEIEEIKSESEENVLEAPFDGVIEEIVRLNEGDRVTEGQRLITMYSTDRLLLKANNAAGKLRYNMSVTIEAGKNDNLKSYTGKVIASPDILPSAVSGDLTLIELDEDITQDQLKGNLKYRCVSEEIHNILLVEREAINRDEGEEFVYVLDGDMVQKRYVETTLHTAEGVWILDGLKEGQTLIVD